MTNANDLINETRYKLEENAEIAYPNHGLTKREYFAAMAMQGYISGNEIQRTERRTSKDMAIYALELADALITALNQTK